MSGSWPNWVNLQESLDWALYRPSLLKSCGFPCGIPTRTQTTELRGWLPLKRGQGGPGCSSLLFLPFQLPAQVPSAACPPVAWSALSPFGAHALRLLCAPCTLHPVSCEDERPRSCCQILRRSLCESTQNGNTESEMGNNLRRYLVSPAFL